MQSGNLTLGGAASYAGGTVVNGGMLTMQWGRTRVDMNLDVTPSYALTMPTGDADPYVIQVSNLDELRAALDDALDA